MPSPTRPAGGTPPALDLSRSARIAVVALAVLGVALFAFFLIRALSEESASARWDELDRLQEKFQPRQDPLFEDPMAEYRQRRDRYLVQLERFLTEHAERKQDALAPHVHWLIAKTCADQILTMKDVVALDRRAPYYEKALRHLEILRDKYPEHPLNWSMFRPTDPLGQEHASLVRMFITKLAANRDWEQQHLPRAAAPDADPVVLIRTERGDLRLGLYAEKAPDLTRRFLARARRGAYDGTAFHAKADSQRGPQDPLEKTIRGGHPDSRDLPAYEARRHLVLDEEPDFDPLLPAPSRVAIPHEAGVVAAWHDPADVYDGSPQFLVVLDRSPNLDYAYSAIGALLDDASRATARRIFEQATWRDDAGVRADTGDLRRVQDFLQAPVRIVKVLVYQGGEVLEPEGEASPHRLPPTAEERLLSSVRTDAYRSEVPARPVRAPGEGPDHDLDPDGDGDGGGEAPGEPPAAPGGDQDD